MRIKKTYQTTPLVSKAVNENSESTSDTYSCDYINNNVGVVESGSNDNGYYVKYADGTMICYKQITTSNTINVAWGSMFIHGYSGISLGDYPKIFTTTPNAQLQLLAPSGAWLMVAAQGNTSRPPSVTLVTGNAVTTNLSFTIGVTAIGKWK